ncbi:MAG: radical SAM protein [Polyangiaceae bacterium]
MRVALIYPPPWKKAAAGDRHGEEGPPPGYQDGDLDGDFYQIPYGLLTIAANLKRAGHQVKVLNLSAFTWPDVEAVVARVQAEVYGLSCWTANRRGVGYVTEAIRAAHPEATIIVGGPHAAPLGREMLRHHPAIDLVATGESEQTMIELCERRARGESFDGLAGVWYRKGKAIERGPERPSVADLDEIESPHRHFATHIFMTSRGCPWACTFCGAESQWGRGFRGNSVGYVLDALEAALAQVPVKMLMIKDDTFTTNRRRVIELCRGIRERKLSFLWSCDTRVDLLSDELLREMRLAGCERLSLGVESGAPSIIAQVDKKITVADIVESTDLAKKYGIKVRYYMMLGNRGETEETFRQTLDFLEQARPHEYIFSCLSIYPGTRDFRDAVGQGWVSPETFFSGSFQELKVPFDADEACTAMMNAWFADHSGLQTLYRPGVDEAQAVLDHLGDHHAARVDLAAALFAAGRLDEAEHHLARAAELGYPAPGLLLNYRACIAVKRGDYDAMMDLYTEAAKRDPQHWVLIKNVERARRWFRDQGPARGIPLELEASHDFRVLERTLQPTLPGPLGEDFDRFDEERFVEAAPQVARVGSRHALRSRKHLKVI